MNPIIKMSAIEALAVSALQSTTKDRSLNYIESNRSRLKTITDLVNEAIEQSKPDNKKSKLVLRSIQILKNSLTSSPSGIMERIQQVYQWLFSSHTNAENREIQEFLAAKEKELPDSEAEVLTDLEALLQFMTEFPTLFGETADVMKGGELVDLVHVSRRIWESENIASLPADKKYQKYKDLMEEDVIGSHLLFEEAAGEPSFFKTVRSAIEEREGNGTERDQVSNRFSSHYVSKLRRENKALEPCSHFEGNLFPETILAEVSVGKKRDGEVFVPNKKATQFESLDGERHINKMSLTQMKVTWRQREAHRDGPDWYSLALHRLIDFPIYWILKKFKNRCQVARHTSVLKGRGVPDTTPILIKKRETSEYFLENLEKPWQLRPEYRFLDPRKDRP